MHRLDLNNRISRFVSEIILDEMDAGSLAVSADAVGDDIYRITVCFDFERQISIDDWKISITPASDPFFHWQPHLTPTDHHIIAQHCFRSPALIVSDRSLSIAVIPDLDLLKESKVKWYMDMDAQKNKLVLGISEYMTDDHVLFLKRPGAVIPEGSHKLGLYLLLSDDEEDIFDPWRMVLSFLWEGWGSRLYEKGMPVSGPLDSYVKHTYDWAFDKWSKNVWQDFTIDGKRVGAPCFIVNVTQSPNYKGEINLRENLSIWNQAWFSSLRSAQGLFRYARRFGRDDLMEKAMMTKELALSAPRKEGFFSTVISTEMEQITVNGKALSRSKGWETYYWGNSNRNPFSGGDIRTAPYHVLDMSWTAYLMLQWYDELEPDRRLRDFALEYGENLIKLQDDNGFFPAWLHPETLKPMGVLDDSPETSMSVTFLLKLFHLTCDRKYLNSALKAMDAVINHIIFQGRWEDFETYWSCCRYGSNDLVGQKIERNNMYKQCNFSMYWTAEALLNCYKTTSDAKYLRLGQRCLDELLMTQASWQPHFIYVNALGGFGVMNCDAEWIDARQSLFAELIIKYGLELDIKEYVQRGLAALRASFVMMYCPENEKTKEQWEKRWPFFNELDYGFMMENYGHDGLTDENGLGIGEFTIYDWGNGAASEAYMRILDHFGRFFIYNN